MASTHRERQAIQRADKLAAIARKVAEGGLSIRQMTPAERVRYGTDDRPPRPVQMGRRRG